MAKGARPSWRRVVTRLGLAYLAIGFSISVFQNAWAAIRGGPSAFVWAGSLEGTLILFFWWFLVPALAWPYELFWAIYHRLVPPP